MNAILEGINSAGREFVEFAGPMLVQSSVLIVILLIGDFLLRRKVRAVLRYWLWMLVLVKLVLPPTLCMPTGIGYWSGLDSWSANSQLSTEIPVKVTVEEADSIAAQYGLEHLPPTPIVLDQPVRTEVPTITDDGTYMPPIQPSELESASPATANLDAPISWRTVVFLTWLLGVAAMGLLLVQRAIFVMGLVAQARSVNGLMGDTLKYCCGRMGVKGEIGLKVSANATSPAVCGLFRPVILVPQDLGPNLGAGGLRVVLMHELAHIRRGDLWVNLVQTVLQIVYFYNPLLWAANAVIRRVREQAVDEAVQVAMGEKAGEYPETLVRVAKLAFERPALSLRLIGVVESKSTLQGRVRRMLERPIPRSAKLGFLGLIVILVAGAILLPMAKGEKSSTGSVATTNGLVAYYPFDGDATDISGNNNHGLHQGTVDYVPGVVGKAARFYGIDERGYIKISNSDSLKLTDVATVAFWVRIEDGAGQTGLDGSGRKVPNAHQVFIAKSGDRVGFVVHSTHETVEKRYIGMEAHNHTPRESGAYFAPKKPLKRWMHIAVTSGDSGTKLYYNGELVKTDSRPTDLSEANPEDIYIGIQAGKGTILPWWFPLNGMIDELRIYNRALSDEEVKSLYDINSSEMGNMSEKAQFIVTLPNGVTVELVGICEHPSRGKQWWRPDGSLIGQVPVRNIDVGGYNIRRGEAAYELVAKLTGPETLLSRSSTPKWKIPQARKVGLGKSGTAKDKNGVPCLRATTAIVKNGLEKIDIEFGLAGVWEKQLTISSNESTKQKIQDTGVVIYPPYQKNSNATITIKKPNKIDSKMVINITAVLKNGKVIGGAAWNRNSKITFMRSTDNYEFHGVNLSDVEHFEIYTSKYEWVEFKNVSLKPDFKTDVETEVEKTGVGLEGGDEGNSKASKNILGEDENDKQTISGVVVDDNGTPLAGVQVVLTNEELALLTEPKKLGTRTVYIISNQASGSTDSNGRFRLVNLKPGETNIVVKMQGYRTAFLHNISSEATDLKVTLGKPMAYLLSGQVVDSEENPISDAQVTLAEESYITISTDQDGRFKFPKKLRPIMTGNMRGLFVQKEGYGTWGKYLDTTGGETYVNVILYPEKSIIGRVIDDRSGGGIEGATVYLWSCPDAKYTNFSYTAKWKEIAPRTRTNVNGEFVLQGVPDNSIVGLRAEAESYESKLLFGIKTGEFQGYARQIDNGFMIGSAEREVGEEIDFRLRRAATLRGIAVYEDFNTPAVGVKIAVQSRNGWVESETDENGQFVLSGVTPESCNVLYVSKVSNSTLLEWTAAAIEIDELEPGEIMDDLTIVLKKGGLIEGRTTDASGNPLKGIDIAFYSAARPRSGAACQHTNTSDDGSWSYRFPPGEVYVYIRTNIPNADWSSKNYTLHLKEGEEISDINFKLNAEVPENSPYKGSTEAKAAVGVEGETEGQKNQQTKTVYLPDVDDKAVMLDLAGGQLIDIPESVTGMEVLAAIDKLDEGDIVFDSTALILVRGASSNSSTPHPGDASVKMYKIGDSLPEELIVTTREGTRYNLKIVTIDDNGINLEYQPLAEQVEGAVGIIQASELGASAVSAEKGLQELIDAAGVGETVIVPEGVYTEPVRINKSLKLKGKSIRGSIFEVTANEPAIFVDAKGKGEVSIEGLTIKWQLATSDKGIEHPFAVAVKDTKAEIKRCNFVPLGNPQRSPVAIRAMGFSNLNIEACRFEGFEYVVCYGEGTEGVMSDSLIMDCGHQGVILYSGAKAKILRNVITGSRYHAVRSTGGTLDLRDNLLINNANRGIYLGNKSAGGVISNNIIMGNGTGISGFARSSVRIQNNIIADSSYAGISMQDSCSLSIRNNILQGNAKGCILDKESSKNANKVFRNLFWQNEADVENFDKPAVSISAEPGFADPDNGDFSLKAGAALENKQGLSDPNVFKVLWRRWKNRDDKNEPFNVPDTKTDAVDGTKEP